MTPALKGASEKHKRARTRAERALREIVATIEQHNPKGTRIGVGWMCDNDLEHIYQTAIAGLPKRVARP